MGQNEGGALVVPDEWSALALGELDGLLMVVGAPDTGKSTFAHWLFGRLAQVGRSTAFLDGDVGQSVLGPPATLTLGMPSSESAAESPLPGALSQTGWNRSHWFVGDVSPRGHMLPLVVGAGRLVARAWETGVKTVIVDTTGLVDRAQGGVALKHALVDQLRPATLFALQRGRELEPILEPLRRLPRPRIVPLPVPDAVRRRGVEARQGHRAAAFRRYFAGARQLRLSLRGLAVFDGSTFAPRRLLALQDADGFALALGVVVNYERDSEQLTLRTPLYKADRVVSLRLGAVGVDLDTGREVRPGQAT
jgi:polynucleotide 5'-hydroxyl-kinase GRC3/NOL9